MAKVIEDTKNKNEDLFINLVSYGKSSNENDQGPLRNVPVGDDLGQTTKSDIQGQEETVVVIEQGNNTQNQEQPTNIPPDDIAQQQKEEQEQQQQEDENEDEDEEENDDDFEFLPNGARAKVSRPPSKRPAPSPKTG